MCTGDWGGSGRRLPAALTAMPRKAAPSRSNSPGLRSTAGAAGVTAAAGWMCAGRAKTLRSGAAEQQPHALLHALVALQPGPPQRQAGPGGRLGPGEVALGPGPTHDLQVNVVQVVVARALRHTALDGQQAGGRLLDLLLRVVQ